MNAAVIVAGALVALALWLRSTAAPAAGVPVGSQAPPAAVGSYPVAAPVQQSPVGYAPGPATPPAAQPTQASQGFSYQLPALPSISGLGGSADPYAVAAIQNAGGILSGLGSLAGALPGAIKGFQGLFSSERPSSDFGYSIDGSFGYSGDIGDTYEGPEYALFYSMEPGGGGGSPVTL